MPTHEHTVNGIRWVCLTGIESNEDEALLKNGEALYRDLFTEEEKEDYEHFRDYLSDSAQARQLPESAEVIDTLSFAFEGSQMRGFLFFTWYPNTRLVFAPYLGFRQTRTRRYFDSVPGVIQGERDVVGLTGKSIEGVLFELEKFDPSKLLPPGRRSRMTQAERTSLKRAQLTLRYQEGGAWMIPWVNYRQPPLEKGGRPLDIHLMYWPIDPARRSDPGVFRRGDIERLVRFTYEQFYLDGFKSTEHRRDWPYWRRLMRQYSAEALRYAPNTDLSFEKISASQTIASAFIS